MSVLDTVTINNMDDFANAVVLFQELAGNTDVLDTKEAVFLRLEQQLKRVREELEETEKAIADRDVIGLRDGAIDMLVTLFGFLHTFGQYFDIMQDARDICLNNLSKIMTDRTIAEATVEMYREQGVDTYINEFVKEGVSYYTVKDVVENKIRKPKGFVSVKLK